MRHFLASVKEFLRLSILKLFVSDFVEKGRAVLLYAGSGV
jgi:hypothetical protein